jgi:hypothetical protein
MRCGNRSPQKPEHRLKSRVAPASRARNPARRQGNRGRHGNATATSDRRNPDRSAAGRAWAVGARSARGLYRPCRIDFGRALVRVLPHLKIENAVRDTASFAASVIAAGDRNPRVVGGPGWIGVDGFAAMLPLNARHRDLSDDAPDRRTKSCQSRSFNVTPCGIAGSAEEKNPS